jgi:glycine cleavage system aminomethyltransferase T
MDAANSYRLSDEQIEQLHAIGQQVGVVASAAATTHAMRSLAIARTIRQISQERAENGQTLAACMATVSVSPAITPEEPAVRPQVRRSAPPPRRGGR